MLVRSGASWPALRVVVERGDPPAAPPSLDDNAAVVRFTNGGALIVDRRAALATYTLPEGASAEELVHPYLAPAAAAMSRWHGREAFHAGAFVSGAGAWGLLAEREGGKSSTLARLAVEGTPILCDDVLVVDGPTAFAGPRAIDLREGAARELAAGRSLGVVGTRERWRMELDQVDAEVELRGWIFLTWDDRVALEPVPPGGRLRVLAGQRAVVLPPLDPTVLLRLAALPGYELRRPHRWSSIGMAVQLLLTELG